MGTYRHKCPSPDFPVKPLQGVCTRIFSAIQFFTKRQNLIESSNFSSSHSIVFGSRFSYSRQEFSCNALADFSSGAF